MDFICLTGTGTRYSFVLEDFLSMDEKPIAYCPLNDVAAYDFPFFIKKGTGVEPDQLLLEVHLWHMTEEEKAVVGELIRISLPADLEHAGYTKDHRGVYIVGEEERCFPGTGFPHDR